MTSLRLLWYYLWIAPHVLQLGVMFAMVRRGVHRQFPMFFLYNAFEILQCSVLVAILASHFRPQYQYAFSIGLALSTAVRFGVIHELFSHFFSRYPTLVGTGRFLFRGATLGFLLVAVALAVSASGNSVSFLWTVTYTFDQVVSMLQSGLLISLFLFSGWFALSWRSQAFGIALGLGVFATVELATSATWLHLGASGSPFINLLTMAAYHCCVLVWLFYVWAPERSSIASVKLPSHDMELWNQELRRLIQQ